MTRTFEAGSTPTSIELRRKAAAERLNKVVSLFVESTAQINSGLSAVDIFNNIPNVAGDYNSFYTMFANWNRDNLLDTVAGKYGSEFKIVRYTFVQRTIIRRALIDLDLHYGRSKDPEQSLPLCPATGGGIIAEYLDDTSMWSYASFINELPQVISKIREQANTELPDYELIHNYFGSSDIEQVLDATAEVGYLRQMIFVSGMSVLEIFRTLGVCDDSGVVTDSRSADGIDKRWKKLMPDFVRLKRLCEQHNLSVQQVADIMPLFSLLSKNNPIAFDDKSLIVLSK